MLLAPYTTSLVDLCWPIFFGNKNTLLLCEIVLWLDDGLVGFAVKSYDKPQSNFLKYLYIFSSFKIGRYRRTGDVWRLLIKLKSYVYFYIRL